MYGNVTRQTEWVVGAVTEQPSWICGFCCQTFRRECYNRTRWGCQAARCPLNGTTRTSCFQAIIPMGSGPGFKLSRVFPQSTTPHHQNSTVSKQLHLWLRGAGLTSIFHCLPTTFAVHRWLSGIGERIEPPRRIPRRGRAWEIVSIQVGRWEVRRIVAAHCWVRGCEPMNCSSP